MATRQRDLMKQEEVLGGYDPAQYRSERLAATAADGTRGADLAGLQAGASLKDGSRPCYSHGLRLLRRAAATPTSPRNRLSLLDRGFVLRHRPHPRRRRAGRAVVRARASCWPRRTPSPTSSPPPSTWSPSATPRTEQAGDPGRQRRRPADGRGRQHAARPLRRGHRQGAVRGRHQHHARRRRSRSPRRSSTSGATPRTRSTSSTC